MMRRREILALVGGVAAWPITARAQQAAMPVIGFVHARSREDSASLVATFRKGLAENGYVEGQNLVIEYRFAAGQYDQLPKLTTELIRRPVTVLVTGADPAAMVGKRATDTIPIVFAVGGDPVKLGLVASLNRPGGNATGITILTTSLEPKRLGLLRELLSPTATLGVFLNPNLPLSQRQSMEVQEAAGAIGLPVRIFWVGTDPEIDNALDTIVQQRIDALMVAADPFFDTRREKLTGWATHHKVPTMFQFREYTVAGGLMSYGVNLPEMYRQVGIYTARILKGVKPAELPVMQPTKFEFVINLKTAKVLGLTLPSGLLSIADEVIE